MWRIPTEAHRIANFVTTTDTERQRLLERGDNEAWGIDPTAHPLPLSAFSWDAYPRGRFVDIITNEGKRFSHARTELIHYNQGKSVACLDTFENGDHRILVGWLDFSLHYAWKLHLPVPGDVGDVGEVQHHTQIADEQTDGTGLVTGGEGADVGDHVTDGDLVDGIIAKRLHEWRGTEPVARDCPVAYVAAGSQPFSVDVADHRVTLDGTFKFTLRVLRGGQPVRYQVFTDRRFPLRPEGSTVLHFAVPPSTPVADVEPAPIPGVPRTNVEGRQ